jgi:hypothetical protein
VAIDENCPLCEGDGWICEDHPDKPFQHDDTTTAAGLASGVAAILAARCGGKKSTPPRTRSAISRRSRIALIRIGEAR